MKYLNIYLIATLAMFLFATSCNEILELEGNLTDPNGVSPELADFNLVLNNAMIEFAQFADEASDETMPYARLTALDGGNRYDNADNSASFDFLWFQAYAEVLPDLDLVIERSGTSFTQHSGIAKTIKAYTLMSLVDLFGDVPYSEAGDGTNFNPKLDSGESVYNAAAALLDEAIAELGSGGPAINTDLFYSTGDQWLRLANSLKLRYNLNTRLVGGSASEINDIVASGNLITDSADDWAFNYGSNRVNPDSRHPYYSDGYEDGGPSWYLSNYYMWLFFGEKDNEDPRLRYYFYRQDCDETDEDPFTLDCLSQPYPSHWDPGFPFCTASLEWGDPNEEYAGYWGRDHGNDDGIPPDDLKRTAWGVYPTGGSFDADNCAQVSNMGTDGLGGAGIQPLIMSSYVYFMRAEAALTMGTNDDARTMLEMGVRQSIGKVIAFGAADADPAFVPTEEAINAYVDEVLSLYDSASEPLEVVMKEYMLALQGQGLEAYNNYRRTCMPSNQQPTRDADPGGYARSFWYPASSVSSNSSISQKGGVTTPVFWDTNPAGCTL